MIMMIMMIMIMIMILMMIIVQLWWRLESPIHVWSKALVILKTDGFIPAVLSVFTKDYSRHHQNNQISYQIKIIIIKVTKSAIKSKSPLSIQTCEGHTRPSLCGIWNLNMLSSEICNQNIWQPIRQLLTETTFDNIMMHDNIWIHVYEKRQ